MIVKECVIKLNMAKGIHDKTLERKGSISESHRTFPIPFNAKLKRKQKFKDNLKVKSFRVLHQTVPLQEIPESMTVPLREANVTIDHAKFFQGNFHSICESDDLLNSSPGYM